MKRVIIAAAIAATMLCADALQLRYIGEAVGGNQGGGNGGTANNHKGPPGGAPHKPEKKQYRLNQIPDLLIGSVVHVFTDFASDVWSDGLFSMAEARERGGLGAGNAARAGGRSVGGLAVGNDGRIAGGI